MMFYVKSIIMVIIASFIYISFSTDCLGDKFTLSSEVRMRLIYDAYSNMKSHKNKFYIAERRHKKRSRRRAAAEKVIQFVMSDSDVSYNQAKQIVIETFKNSDRPYLLLSIFKRESNYNPKAVNKTSGAVGLGQIMPGNLGILRKYGLHINSANELKRIHKGILAADIMLSVHIEEANGNVRHGLYGYLGGISSRYVSNVFNTMSTLKSLTGNYDISSVEEY